MLLSLCSGVAGLHTPLTGHATVRHRCALLRMMDAEASVAEWCASSGREDAAVTILEGQNTAQVLRDFWYVARAMGETGMAGQRVVAFPHWAEAVAEPRQFQAVLNHIGLCSETCEYLGESLMCVGRHPASETADEAAAPYPLMLLRSFSRKEPDMELLAGGEELPWFYLDDDEADPIGGLGLDDDAPPAPPASDEEVLDATYKWVDAVIVHMKVCPFSSSTFKAGLPIGGVCYPLSRATTSEEMYQAFWQEVENLQLTDERELATTLLVAPDFAPYSASGFDAFADTLNNALSSLGLEEQLQLVFFHPEYTFRDGQNRFGTENEGAAANYARRSPYPMINLLRTPQVRAAQKGVPTGSVYTTNEGNLATIGSAKLQAMLERREWGGILSEKGFKKQNVDVIRGV
jgi:hypothetical protein